MNLQSFKGMWIIFIIFFILCVPAKGTTIASYDLHYVDTMNPADAYEEMHLVAAISGLVNRQGPLLFVNYTNEDVGWLSWLQQSGKWLHGASIVVIPHGVDNLLHHFASILPSPLSAVVYDPAVPSTSMVASTAAGAEDLLPFCQRDGGLYTQFVASSKIKVGLNLVGLFPSGKTGSAKCDAYIWAADRYLTSSSSACDGSKMAYYLDYWWVHDASQPFGLNTVVNHDYWIGQRAFFWDLSPWGDEAPNDDPTQPLGTDLKAMQTILLAAYEKTKGKQMITVGGFTPWKFKYVDAKHGGVATEWETVRILSAYNALVDADACCVQVMANAAFFTHMPLASQYNQPHPTVETLTSKGYLVNGKVVPRLYVFFYAGDWDSAAWLNTQLPGVWKDPKRGSVPMGWALDPNLSIRFPPAFDMVYSSLSSNDSIITGDSGAGYINPTQLLPPRISNLPSAKETWISHCAPLYNKFDIRFTGFLINGDSGALTEESEEMYSSFSTMGVVGDRKAHMTGSIPSIPHVSDLPASSNDAADQIRQHRPPSGQADFQMWRGVLRGPSFYAAVRDALLANPGNGENGIQVVLPEECALLAKISLGK